MILLVGRYHWETKNERIGFGTSLCTKNKIYILFIAPRLQPTPFLEGEYVSFRCCIDLPSSSIIVASPDENSLLPQIGKIVGM